MDLRAHLKGQLARRTERNPRYSLRAFARTLGTHHTTLARILAGRQRVTPALIRRLGESLDLSCTHVERACVEEYARIILRLTADPHFRADARWIATRGGIPMDDVQRTLHVLLLERRIEMREPETWTVTTS